MSNMIEKILGEIRDLLGNDNMRNTPLPVRYTTEKVFKNDKIKSECNTVSFLNASNMTVFVNEIPLAEGSGLLSFGNEINLIDKTDWTIKFDESTVPTGETPNKELVVIKRHIEGKFNYFNVVK